MSLRVAFISGPLRGSRTAIPGSGLRLGRSEENDLAIPDPSPSRQHCALELKQELESVRKRPSA